MYSKKLWSRDFSLKEKTDSPTEVPSTDFHEKEEEEEGWALKSAEKSKTFQ